ncbi:putative transmembrane protein [Klebsiella pneumoniae]|nr:putative transmembrane protein [Klebsiella pneumoniae]
MNALLYALVVVIWGTTWIAIFLQQGPVAAPVSIFWRFAVASVTMLAILLVTRRLRPLGAKDHLCCLLQGCCVFCFNFWCFYTAAAWINTGLESVIFSMAVLFNAINSFLFFRQQPPGRFWAAAALGLAGIVILFWDDLLANGLNASLLWGIGLSALGTYGFSLGNMFSIRHQRRGLETLTTNSWAMLYGTLVMGAIALLRGDNFYARMDRQLSGRPALPGAVRLGHRLWRLFHSRWAHRRQQSRLQYAAVSAGRLIHFHRL